MPRVLEVVRTDLRTARVVDDPAVPLEDGQVRFRIDRFGLTANNVTYGALGDLLRYWTFFPASEDGWGRVPAWGFATAVESRCPEVAEGLTVFGYVPQAEEVVMTPADVRDTGFREASPHRAELPGAYNAYRGVEGQADEVLPILQPLLMTSVLLARAVEGAERVVLSSASSKTALGTAFLAARAGKEVVGLTSARNADWVAGLDVYGEVLPYDAIGEELEVRPATFVDLAGDGAVRAAVHQRLGDALQASIMVGATHHEMLGAGGGEELPGPQPTMFFAPDHLKDGIGGEGIAAFGALLEWSRTWLEVQRHDGPEQGLAAWVALVDGEVAPTTGLSVALA